MPINPWMNEAEVALYTAQQHVELARQRLQNVIDALQQTGTALQQAAKAEAGGHAGSGLRKFTDEERQALQHPLRCYDCGLLYSDNPAWMDAMIPDEAWEAINPTYDEGAGILCITCINRRCHEAGLQNVPVMIMSGSLISKENPNDS